MTKLVKDENGDLITDLHILNGRKKYFFQPYTVQRGK
jgi:hypothetical protein